MATEKCDPRCEFDKLFTNYVPDILEKIFFALDYDSFIACGKVCKAWRELFSSQSYNLKAEELRAEMVKSGLLATKCGKMKVRCESTTAVLDASKFESGSKGKCIQG